MKKVYWLLFIGIINLWEFVQIALIESKNFQKFFSRKPYTHRFSNPSFFLHKIFKKSSKNFHNFLKIFYLL